MTQILDSLRHFDLSNWWSIKTLFQLNPPLEWKFRIPYVILTVFCLVAALVISFPKFPLHQNLRRKWGNLFWTSGLVGIVFYFSRLQQITFLGMDGLRTIQEITFVLWVNSILWYTRTTHKKELIQTKVSERYHKYLPKQKAK